MLSLTQKILTQVIIIVVIVAAIAIIITTVLTNNTQCLESLFKNEDADTLISVQVILRHGIRTPDPGALYPNDVYNNYSFYPDNNGDLTQNGRKYSYILGKALRGRYDDFLGDDYYPGIVKSLTSDYDRTQLSLQCVHAGLFSNQKSIIGIPWRPITFESIDFEDDNIIGIMANCKALPRPTHRPSDNETIELFKYLSEKAGVEIVNYFDILSVSNAFEVETANGLELPDWGKPLYPEPIISYDKIAWMGWIELNLRYGVAGLLKTITDNAMEAISKLDKNIYDSVTPKVVLFSGHEYNLQFLAHAIGIKHLSSTYSAYMIFELHKINGVYGFKIFYNNFSDGKLIALDVDFCKNATDVEMFCPLDIFIWNTEWLYDPPPSCPGAYY